MTNTPIKDKTKQKSGFNINNYNCQIAHSTKNSKKDRGSRDIHFKTSKKFTPLLMVNIDDFTKCKSANAASGISKKPHQKSLFSNNDKSIGHFERKERPDICVTENYIKNLIPVTISGNSNYPCISKNGRKTIYLPNLATSILRKNFIEFVNIYLFSNSHDRF